MIPLIILGLLLLVMALVFFLQRRIIAALSVLIVGIVLIWRGLTIGG